MSDDDLPPQVLDPVEEMSELAVRAELAWWRHFRTRFLPSALTSFPRVGSPLIRAYLLVGPRERPLHAVRPCWEIDGRTANVLDPALWEERQASGDWRPVTHLWEDDATPVVRRIAL